jgi:hypothetical protein
MTRRLTWLVLGFALGFWSAFRLKRALMPKSLAAGLGHSAREFAGDVRVAMKTREDELRDALGLAAQAHVDKDPH